MNKYGMMNIKHILLGFFFLGMVFPLMGQGNNERDIESIRIAYITRQLNLSPEESQVFWPVYNQYQDELQAFKKDRRKELREAKQNFDVLSDKEVEEVVDDMVQMKQQELDLFLKYHEEFKKILPIRKVAKLYKAESEFTQKLLNRLQKRREEMQGNGGRGRPGR